VSDYRQVMAVIKRLSRLYPESALEQMVYTDRLSVSDLGDHEKVQSWCVKLANKLDEGQSSGSNRYLVTIKEDTERALFLPQIEVLAHGLSHEYPFSHDFFASGEYQSIVDLGSKITDLIEEGAYIQRGEKRQPTSSFKAALTWLMAESKKGYNIQRYKGLGEMNPEQLWETTMDPSTRRMLKVRIEDAISADQIFTTLMGDQVEPRREFIENNALSVENLDV
jgi:DNA gyrase subunit B